MGFISFNLTFYKSELQRLKNSPVNEATIYRAKQLKKMLDDLLDEGYTELNDKLEEACFGVTELQSYLKRNSIEPFPRCRKPYSEKNVLYGQNAVELTEAVKNLIENAENSTPICRNSFIAKLIGFCKQIDYREDTAYIFLLRDTLLPYIYFLNKDRKNIYPWLLNRKSLAALTGVNNVDDEIRASIFGALELDWCKNFNNFCDSVLPHIRSNFVTKYPKAANVLLEMLGKIKEKHIVVVESGCSGTFPMLLMSLDDRADMRMYTTYPYLLNIYGSRIYSAEYEDCRRFETLCSQDLYFRFSKLSGGKFYVNKCACSEAEKQAIAEVKTLLMLSSAENS